jgi:hypothetical protein
MKAFERVEETEETSPTSGSTITEQYAYQATNANDDVKDGLSPALDRMAVDMDMDAHPSPTEGTASIADYREVPEYQQPPLWSYARQIRGCVKEQADMLARAARSRGIDLTRLCTALTLAESVTDIVDLTLQILARIDYLRKILTGEYEAQENILSTAEALRMPEGILARHRATVVEYKKYEYDTRVVYMNMKHQIEHLKSRQVREKHAPN